MVRVYARQHCFRLKCSVVQQRGDAKVVAAAVHCRRCINLAQGRPASRCNCFKRIFAVENPRPAILRWCTLAALTTRIADAAPFDVIPQPSRTSAGPGSRSPGPAHDC